MNELKLAIGLLIANDFEDAAMFLDGLSYDDLPEGEIEWSGQAELPCDAEMKPQGPEVLYTLRECKNGKNTEVHYNRVVWYVPTALLKARGLKLAALELKHTAQEGMKPRWDELLKIL